MFTNLLADVLPTSILVVSGLACLAVIVLFAGLVIFVFILMNRASAGLKEDTALEDWHDEHEKRSRRAAEESFPKPEWPPIQNFNSIDITGKRRDGGVDLVIVASQPIDDSPQTLDSLRRKVGNYLTAIGMEEFQAEMGHPPPEKTAIIIACDHPIHAKATLVIQECQASAAIQGVRLEVRKSMG
jgi:hypothetical protein